MIIWTEMQRRIGSLLNVKKFVTYGLIVCYIFESAFKKRERG